MRYSTLTTLAFAYTFGLLGCAHTREDARMVTATGETAPPTVDREVLAIDSTPPPVESAVVTRPRLSQTVTLGQGTEAQYTPGPAPVPPGTSTGQQGVVINNNITVNGAAPPQYYGGYAGYRGYTGYGAYGRPTFNDGRTGSRASSVPQWGSTGWEGARRTAAPGQTPGVGGNWSAAPSYGPSPMR